MVSSEEIIEKFREKGLDFLVPYVERLRDFAEKVAEETGGEIVGYATEVFPGAFVLNVFLDVAVTVEREVLLEAEAGKENVTLRVGNAELSLPKVEDATFKEEEAEGMISVSAEKSRNVENFLGRALRKASVPVSPGKTLLFIYRPTWLVLHVEITSYDHAKRVIDHYGVSIA